MRTYHVYILASHSRRLYVGVTSDLRRRVAEHRSGALPGHTRRYRITQLVHFEAWTDARAAIAREKQLKRWPRERKFRLIEARNLAWRDLAADLFPTSGDSDRRRLGEGGQASWQGR